jgi:hypothetical protein
MAPTRRARFASMVRILVNPFLEAGRFQAYVIESSPGPRRYVGHRYLARANSTDTLSPSL